MHIFLSEDMGVFLRFLAEKQNLRPESVMVGES